MGTRLKGGVLGEAEGFGPGHEFWKKYWYWVVIGWRGVAPEFGDSTEVE
jgi:hypothetical protein